MNTLTFRVVLSSHPFFIEHDVQSLSALSLLTCIHADAHKWAAIHLDGAQEAIIKMHNLF